MNKTAVDIRNTCSVLEEALRRLESLKRDSIIDYNIHRAQGHLVVAIFHLTAAHTKLVRGVSGENSSHNSYDMMSCTYLPSKDKK